MIREYISIINNDIDTLIYQLKKKGYNGCIYSKEYLGIVMHVKHNMNGLLESKILSTKNRRIKNLQCRYLLTLLKTYKTNGVMGVIKYYDPLLVIPKVIKLKKSNRPQIKRRLSSMYDAISVGGEYKIQYTFGELKQALAEEPYVKFNNNGEVVKEAEEPVDDDYIWDANEEMEEDQVEEDIAFLEKELPY